MKEKQKGLNYVNVKVEEEGTFSRKRGTFSSTQFLGRSHVLNNPFLLETVFMESTKKIKIFPIKYLTTRCIFLKGNLSSRLGPLDL
ncbi:hypothetical protein HanPSC8_Chr13g0571261 [Helianthus annuus]|nr:hypothetical protein HanPSC8_Chr13g0571261 [Helianthus annuus]